MIIRSETISLSPSKVTSNLIVPPAKRELLLIRSVKVNLIIIAEDGASLESSEIGSDFSYYKSLNLVLISDWISLCWYISHDRLVIEISSFNEVILLISINELLRLSLLGFK